MIQRGTQIFAAIAQMPGGPSANIFTLVPLIFADGSAVEPSDFPDHGLVFWSAQRRELGPHLSPGSITFASVEVTPSTDIRNPLDRHLFLVESGSVRAPYASELLEVLTYEHEISHPRELLSSDMFSLQRPPLERVFIETPTHLLGPFATEAVMDDSLQNQHAVHLQALSEIVDVFDLNTSQLSNLVHEVSAQISLRAMSPSRNASGTIRCSYKLVSADRYDAIRSLSKRQIVVTTPEQALRPLLRRFIAEGRYKQFFPVLEEFLSQLDSSASELTLAQEEAIDALKSALTQDRRLVRELSDALLGSGLLTPTLNERVEAHTKAYVEQNTAELQEQIEFRTAARQKELDALESRINSQSAELDAQKRRADQVLAERESKFNADCNAKTARLDDERRRLTIESEDVARRLEVASRTHYESRDSVIQDLTRILPFINNQHSANQQTITTENAASSTKPPIAFPAFILRAAGGYTPIDEIVFFERFCSHVESQGFRYRRADLISFHLNFRTSEFFILGGLSGTGKSSLPRLYMEALVGDEIKEIQRLHRVTVNPTWMNVNDVLGRVNLLDRTYNPSESGIYRHLIFAEQEYRNLALESGFWPLVLDEMNLAQVEHYFGAFMQKFGVSDDRGLRIFDEAVVRSEDPFAPWSLLSLPPSLRFIGTVNFDETTRPLSQRLLDRGPLMLIDVAPRTATSGTPRQAAGPAVSLRNLQDWSSIKQAAPPPRKERNYSVTSTLSYEGSAAPSIRDAERQSLFSCKALHLGSPLQTRLSIWCCLSAFFRL